MGKAEGQSAAMLPKLREELSIEPGGTALSGAPTWLIHDPLRNRFFRINVEMFQMLALWCHASMEEFLQLCCRKLGRDVDEGEINRLVEFLYRNSLTTSQPQGEYKEFYRQHLAARRSPGKALLHNYLFFRIPLARPQAFLDATWSLVSPFFSQAAVWVYFLCGLSGLYLVSRQWDQFVTTFLGFLTLEGVIYYSMSLVALKILHELGHAYMAVKYGMKVPTIGVAFLLLMPVLYTDTSDAWRLTDRRKRLMVDLAGIYTELAIASVSTLAWVFLQDGPLRSIAFMVATLSWVMSLAVNLNPFMRFDGYYVFSDLIGVENLQERGFALGRWRMREFLFSLGDPQPEAFSTGQRRLLTAYAYGTWVYRFFLFLGIALLVYQFFFKAVAVFLFAVEILWFIVLPVWKELMMWWQRRADIAASKRSWISFASLGLLIAVLIIPWETRVDVPAILTDDRVVSVFPSASGKIASINLAEGAAVKKGDVLAEMVSPELENELLLSSKRAELLQVRLRRIAADRRDLALSRILREELLAENERYAGLEKRGRELRLTAPMDGVVSNADRELHIGMWLGTDKPVAILRSRSDSALYGMVAEENLRRVARGSTGRFIPDDSTQAAIPVTIEKIGATGSRSLPHPMLADVFGGRVPVNQSGSGSNAKDLKPTGGWYRVDMKPEAGFDVGRVNRISSGVVVLKGTPESYFARIYRRVFAVLIREAGV